MANENINKARSYLKKAYTPTLVGRKLVNKDIRIEDRRNEINKWFTKQYTVGKNI